MNINAYRRPDHDISPIFISRWSPRAMSGEQISREELMRLFEAARWAPSSFNNQSWRFAYALRETEHWDAFYDLLTRGNQEWCRNAAVLMIVISKTTFDFNGKPARTHSFDTGAAWCSLALQGSLMGLVVHGMQGFNYDRAKEAVRLGDEYQVEAMAAIGRPGKKDDLPLPLQEKEFPSGRKRVEEFAFEGVFGK